MDSKIGEIVNDKFWGLKLLIKLWELRCIIILSFYLLVQYSRVDATGGIFEVINTKWSKAPAISIGTTFSLHLDLSSTLTNWVRPNPLHHPTTTITVKSLLRIQAVFRDRRITKSAPAHTRIRHPPFSIDLGNGTNSSSRIHHQSKELLELILHEASPTKLQV